MSISRPRNFIVLRHVAVDVDGLAVVAVAGEIRNVVIAVELLDPPHDGVERAIDHQARDVPFGHPELLVRGFRVAKIERHRGISIAFPCGARIIARDDLNLARRQHPNPALSGALRGRRFFAAVGL